MAVMVLTSTGAFANNITDPVTIIGGTATYGAIHTDNLNFTDTFNFTPGAGAVLANASLITIGFTPSENIDFTSALLNGVALTLSPTGNVETAFTVTNLALSFPLQLVVTGHSGATGTGPGHSASYSGTLNITAVPEASTVILIGLSLVVIGFIARRSLWA
jgi:hypothetical protein